MDATFHPVDPAVGRVCAGARFHRPKVRRVQKHHIWPKGWGGPTTEAPSAKHTVWDYLCGSCHDTVHELLDAWRRHDGPPPWTVRIRYGVRIRDLAREGFQRWDMAGRPDGDA